MSTPVQSSLHDDGERRRLKRGWMRPKRLKKRPSRAWAKGMRAPGQDASVDRADNRHQHDSRERRSPRAAPWSARPPSAPTRSGRGNFGHRHHVHVGKVRAMM